MSRKLSVSKLSNVLKTITLSTLIFLAACGILMTFAPVKPFWLDEWFIIYNIKTKTAPELWGELSYIQQFPRLYLQLVKHFSELFGYSYSSLRLPSFFIHVSATLFCYRLSGRIFTGQPILRFLWVMLYVSFGTSLEYYVQVKPYTMDMFLGLVGIWQLLSLKEIADNPQVKKGPKYAILLLSIALAPFFSYTYPIVIAPVLLLMPVYVWKNSSIKQAFPVFAPLLLSVISIVTFYLVDVTQVMRDQGMQTGWADYMLQDGFDAQVFFSKSFQLFVNMGAGDMFGNICGVVGVGGLLYSTLMAIRSSMSGSSNTVLLRAYAVVFVWILLGLFVAGKIPLGAHRVNAFATPALAYLIVSFLPATGYHSRLRHAPTVLAVFLFLGASGNVFSTFINHYANADEKKKLTIYNNVKRALKLARTYNIPLLAAPEVNYPYTGQVRADHMLLAHPSYYMSQPVLIYNTTDLENAKRLQDSLSINHAVFTNGSDVVLLKRSS